MHPEIRFGDLLDLPLRSGVTVASANRGCGINMLNMGELFRFSRIPAVDMARVDIDFSDSDRYLLTIGDLMFARRSLTLEGAGKCSIVHGVPEPTTWESSIIRARVDRYRADPRFYFYYFASPAGRRSIETIVEQVAAAGIRLSELSSLLVPLPPLAVQGAIADTLGALDDKIDVNLVLAVQTNALVRALFKDISAKADTHRALSEIAAITKGVSYRSGDLKPSETALVTLKSVTRYGTYADRGLKSYSGPYAAQQIIKSGDIVIAQTDLTQAAEVVGRAVRVAPSTDYTVLVASLDLAIARPRAGVPAEFLLGVLSEERFHRHCQSYATGTTVLHLAPTAFETYLAPVITAAEQHKFARKIRPLHDLIDSLAQENRSLAALRDTLLPELMSGKLRVKDAEKQVEEVV